MEVIKSVVHVVTGSREIDFSSRRKVIAESGNSREASLHAILDFLRKKNVISQELLMATKVQMFFDLWYTKVKHQFVELK